MPGLHSYREHSSRLWGICEWDEVCPKAELESNWKVESFKRKAKRFLKAKSKKQKWKKIEKLKVKSRSFIYITFFHIFTTPLHEQLKNFISSFKPRLYYDSLSW